MAARAPAGSLAQARGMIHSTDQDCPALGLLEVALEAEGGVALGEQLGVDATVRGVATGAAFAHGFVLKNINPLLRCMTLRAVFLL